MKDFSSFTRVFRIRFLALSAPVLLLLSVAQGQSVDEVHISPRVSPDSIQAITSPMTSTRPSADVAVSKSLHVSVDVVLVPVSVSDRKNRVVTTLNRKDFVLFEE